MIIICFIGNSLNFICQFIIYFAEFRILLLCDLRKTSESTAYPIGCILAHILSVLDRFRLLFNFVYCCHILISYCMNVCSRSSLWLHFPFRGEVFEVFECI